MSIVSGSRAGLRSIRRLRGFLRISGPTRADAESLLTESNKEDLYLRMDRYFLYDDSEDLTYKGYLRATAFYNIRYGSTIVRSDSLKVSYDVCVKFMDKRYKSYIIQLER